MFTITADLWRDWSQSGIAGSISWRSQYLLTAVQRGTPWAAFGQRITCLPHGRGGDSLGRWQRILVGVLSLG